MSNVFRATKANSPIEYTHWILAKQRCYDPEHPPFKYYGGKGIEMCDRWASFRAFYDDMGKCPEGYHLDRIDLEKDFTPDNCKWVKHKKHFNSTLLRYKGKLWPLPTLARSHGKKPYLIHQRMRRGMTLEKALTEPIRHKRPNRKLRQPGEPRLSGEE